jgi:hypothetical protein
MPDCPTETAIARSFVKGLEALIGAMPTVLRIGSFRLHFYSDEGSEPPHIHVRCPDGECKFWLEPIALARNRGVRARDLREIERLVFAYRQFLLERFHDYHRR